MKYILLLTFFYLPIFFVQCFAQKKVDYILPDNIKTDIEKKIFIKKFKKGLSLYKVNCEKCHTTVVNKKKIIPDFSLPQLLDYEIRFAYPEHQDPMKEVIISKEQLDMILLFLQYKKRNEIAKTAN
ncbi:MAG: hypothetical protein ACK504_05330 [Bacteroidota bacterium]|jgi:hypothetical protein